ncbi:L-aspartate oxidase [Parcubacteria bacterium DG_74_2]|nr:MAG: L-aspartate oxidase [Parcubacteria bacterium DG_74_2]
MNKKVLQTDVLIIGSGIAGITAALELAENKNLKIVLITRTKEPGESNTKYAQGGIVGKSDDDDALREDIIKAGAGLCNPKAVDILVKEGPKLVSEFLIKKLGIKFSTDIKGKLLFTKESAHSSPRILHAQDSTGEVIEEKLIKAVMSCKNIKFFNQHTLIDILTFPHHASDALVVYDEIICIGAYVFDQVNKQVKTILAKKTVLATGGLGQIFLRTVNCKGARGDGLAAASRAGAEIINAEYIQFHPTAFYHRDIKNFLISEAVRGEGAKLRNKKGKAFLKKCDPREELAPRDIVARCIYDEILNKDQNYVLLDLAPYMTPGYIKRRFPKIYKTCFKYGVDITKEPIPVTPSAHYFCGGVKVDQWGRTTIFNLYAVGEVSCTGVHGANRLASTSLLECLVWGKRCASHILRNLGKQDISLSEVLPWHGVGKPDEEVDPALIAQDWMIIKSTMWNYVGIVRTQKRLQRAVSDLNYLKHRIEKFYKETRINDELIGLRNGIEIALIVAEAALRNKKSMGCHFRKN